MGRNFDPREFARTFKRARVNSVTVFAKCHHGHLYYDSKRPERHPGMKKGLDLLGEQVEALHREGIRAPIYLSVQCDEYAADTYPQWIARKPDGTTVGAAPLSPGWQILDMSSPYQDFLAEQTQEVLKRFKPVDGLFFDMCWDQPSLNNYAVEGMIARNLNPESESDRAAYAHQVSLDYMKRFYEMVKGANRDASVYFNSRPLSNLAEEIDYLTQVEIEALPTGGWGYMYFPKNVRFARTFDRPYLGMTARFHKSWADFGGLKPYAALEYEVSQMIAHGAQCSIGDQLHPRGTTDEATYDLIGRVYERVEQREAWLAGARSVAQIGLFQTPAPLGRGAKASDGVDEGATRMLTQLKHQFDVVGTSSELDRYQLLILPDAIPVDTAMAKKLTAYVKKGGALLVSGTSAMNADATQSALGDLLGIKPRGLSPFQTTYLRFMKGFDDGVAPSDHVMYERGVQVTPAAGTQVAAKIVEPYFDRSWKHFSSHAQTPGDKVSRFPAAILKGPTAYIAFPIFGAYAAHGNVPYRQLVGNLLEKLLPEPLLRVAGPSGLEATVMRQSSPARTIVHLLYYSPERRTPKLDIVEDIIPLHELPVSLKLEKSPRRVYLAPDSTDVPFEYLNARVNLRLPELRGHAMIVFE